MVSHVIFICPCFFRLIKSEIEHLLRAICIPFQKLFILFAYISNWLKDKRMNQWNKPESPNHIFIVSSRTKVILLV